ncbi:hypothetical protein HK405_007877, partial [Cladochytrium tenue]
PNAVKVEVVARSPSRSPSPLKGSKAPVNEAPSQTVQEVKVKTVEEPKVESALQDSIVTVVPSPKDTTANSPSEGTKDKEIIVEPKSADTAVKSEALVETPQIVKAEVEVAQVTEPVSTIDAQMTAEPLEDLKPDNAVDESRETHAGSEEKTVVEQIGGDGNTVTSHAGDDEKAVVAEQPDKEASDKVTELKSNGEKSEKAQKPARGSSTDSTKRPPLAPATETPKSSVVNPNRKISTLKVFDAVTYPEGVSAPSVTSKGIRYSMDLLLALNHAALPAPTNMIKIDAGAEDSKASPRTSTRVPSRSSAFPSMGGRNAQPGLGVGVPGVMTTIPAPMPSRGPPQRQSSGRGPSSGGRGSGHAGLPPRPGAHGPRNSGGPFRGTLPPEPVHEVLKVGENAWTPDVQKKKKDESKSEEDPELAAVADITKKVKGLLNKLTVEKFDSISDKILALPITTRDNLKAVIENIYDKAVDEYHFQNMYGRLCWKLSSKLPEVQKWIDMNTKNNIFRRLLLNKCQEEFEKSEKWTREDDEGNLSRQERLKKLHEMSSEEKERYAEEQFQRTKLKRRVLGNISFIGELFKLGMITEKIMHSCVLQLMKNVADPEEEETESLCKLLTSIGEKLDHEQAKKHVDSYFDQIKRLSVNQKLPSRIRFMLQDLMELRANNWKSRTEQVGPLTIAEIHALEEKRKAEEEEARQRATTTGRSRGGGGGRSAGGYGGRPVSMGSAPPRSGSNASQDARAGPDGWTQVKSSRTMDENLGNFGKVESQKRPISFGPQGMGGWLRSAGSGSSATTRADDSEKGRKASVATLPAANKFSVLEVTERKSSTEEKSSGPAPVDHSKVTTEPSEDTKKQFEKEIDGLTEEWNSHYNVEEAMLSLKQLASQGVAVLAANQFLNSVLDRKPEAVEKTAALEVTMVKEGIITAADFKAILKEIVECLPDLVVDIPAIYTYFGVIFGKQAAAKNPGFTLSAFHELLQGEINRKARVPPPVTKALLEVLRAVKAARGTAGLYEVRDISFDLLFPPSARSAEAISKFLADNELPEDLYSLSTAPASVTAASSALATPTPVPSQVYSPPSSAEIKKLETGFRERLGRDTADAVFKWLNTFEKSKGSPEFLRLVTLAILRSVSSGKNAKAAQSSAQFQHMSKIILGFKSTFVRLIRLIEEPERIRQMELEVLFACQSFWSETGRMPDFLHQLFRIFVSSDEIISLESALAWQDASAPVREAESRSAALADVADYL